MINHLAVIMDGNRRWAKKRALMPWLGHKQGVQTVKNFVEFCIEKKIKHTSIYAFSLENLKRSKQELNFIFNIIIEESEKILPDLIKNEIRINFCGEKSLFPKHVKPTIERLEKQTEMFNKLYLNVLFCYGGKQEILSAVQNIAMAVKNGILEPSDINDQIFDTQLWTFGIPEPDLIIRTGGQLRLSNFLLYKSGYSELYFTNQFWPDLTKEDFEKALLEFEKRNRNMGK